jgi:hypothetical protein
LSQLWNPKAVFLYELSKMWEKTMTDKKAIKLAIDYLSDHRMGKHVIEALEEALAKQEQGEPVAFPVTMPWDGKPEKHPQFYTWTWDEFVGGARWRAEYAWDKPERKVTNLQALYTTPQPQSEARGLSQSKPLTITEIAEGRDDADPSGEDICVWSFAKGVQWAERKHGIKE